MAINLDRKTSFVEHSKKINNLNRKEIYEKQIFRELNNQETSLYAQKPKLNDDKEIYEEKSVHFETDNREIFNQSKTKKTKNQALEEIELKKLEKMLQETIQFCCLENTLYYFNKIIYKAIKEDELTTLFMLEVDESLLDAKTLKPIDQLYKFMLRDPNIKKQIKETEQFKCFTALNNITVDVEEWKFYHHSKERLIFTSINADFKKNPSAPNFNRFLREITNNDPILIARMWEFIGYLFIRSLDAKAMFVMGTASNSGKSMLCRFLASLFDENQVCNLSIFNFNDMFSTGQLVDKVLNISPDLPKEALSDKAISILKALTGDDKITARNMYKDPKPYRNRAKFVFTTNHPLMLSTDDKAFWERIVILPFLNSVPKSEQNHKLYELFGDEKDDIVTIALHHCHNLIKNNFIFSSNITVKCMEQQWMGISSGLIDTFLSAICTITGDEKDRVLVSELYDRYTKFCAKYEVDIVGPNQFSSYLENSVSGVSRKRFRIESCNPRSCCTGIKLKEGNRIILPQYSDPNYVINPER